MTNEARVCCEPASHQLETNAEPRKQMARPASKELASSLVHVRRLRVWRESSRNRKCVTERRARNWVSL